VDLFEVVERRRSVRAFAPEEVEVDKVAQALAAAKYRERGARLYAIRDAMIACVFAMLAATAVGRSTIWAGAFDEAAALAHRSGVQSSTS
jgi:nitroreductase